MGKFDFMIIGHPRSGNSANDQPMPEAKFIHSTHTGHTALWVVFTLFTLGVIGVFVMSARVQRKARVFHWYVLFAQRLMGDADS